MSNETNKQGTKIISATATGSRFNQHKSINWSYRSLGRVARTNTNKKQGKQVFKPKNIDCKLKIDSFTKISGILYPPKNNIDVIDENKIIELYSLKKKNTKIIELCSVKNPATSSDSASCRSKGVLLVSANTDIKKKQKTGNRGTTYQMACWFSMIVVKFKLPDNIITINIAELSINS